MKKTIFALMLVFCLTLCACSISNQSTFSPTEGLEYTLLDNGTYEVSGIGTATDLDISIPAKYNGKAVTSIASDAFYGCHNIKSVKISKGITSIGARAFSDCISIKSIILPDSLQSIGQGAFLGCTSLVYKEYDGARYLGSTSNPYLALVSAKSTDIKECQVNKSTEFICSSAFYLCTLLETVEIPNSVSHIGARAFQGCFSLKNITLPSAISTIEDEAFTGCASLVSINLPSSVSSIGASAFQGCASLESISLPENLKTIRSFAFANCTSIKEIYLPDSITNLEACVFYFCTSLTKVECEADAPGDFWVPDWLAYCDAEASFGVKNN